MTFVIKEVNIEIWYDFSWVFVKEGINTRSYSCNSIVIKLTNHFTKSFSWNVIWRCGLGGLSGHYWYFDRCGNCCWKYGTYNPVRPRVCSESRSSLCRRMLRRRESLHFGSWYWCCLANAWYWLVLWTGTCLPICGWRALLSIFLHQWGCEDRSWHWIFCCIHWWNRGTRRAYCVRSIKCSPLRW